eukprot:gene8071-12532_t
MHLTKLPCLEPEIVLSPPDFPLMNLFKREEITTASAASSQKQFFQTFNKLVAITPRMDKEHKIPQYQKTTEVNSLKVEKPKYNMKSLKRNTQFNNGHWSELEHRNFMKGYEVCGRQWAQIAKEFVKTRSRIQVISHAQQFIK